MIVFILLACVDLEAGVSERSVIDVVFIVDVLVVLVGFLDGLGRLCLVICFNLVLGE